MTPDPQEQTPDLDHIQRAAKRLIAVQNEVLAMPEDQRDWFFSKQGHSDAFDLAWFVNIYLPALVKYTRSLQARLAEAEMDKWLPIDTAPRDTNLIGAMLVDGRPVRACMIYWGISAGMSHIPVSQRIT